MAIQPYLEGSRSLLKNNPFLDTETARHYHSRFRDHGIAESHIELMAWQPGLQANVDLYNRIDIALDTFPFNGTTTSFEALWTDVPVVTLAGSQHAGRVGVSILGNLGMHDLVAATKADYVQIAGRLAMEKADQTPVPAHVTTLTAYTVLSARCGRIHA